VRDEFEFRGIFASIYFLKRIGVGGASTNKSIQFKKKIT